MPFNGVDVLMLLFTAAGFSFAVWAAVSAHRSAEAAKRSANAASDSVKEAKRANHLAERPEIAIELGRAGDIHFALGIIFRSDTELKSLRITKTETFINGRAIVSGEWRASVVAQHSVGQSEHYGNTLVFSEVKVNRPLFVTWIPWHGHQGRHFQLRIDLDLLCVGYDGREWSLAKSIEHQMPGARGVQ